MVPIAISFFRMSASREGGGMSRGRTKLTGKMDYTPPPTHTHTHTRTPPHRIIPKHDNQPPSVPVPNMSFRLTTCLPRPVMTLRLGFALPTLSTPASPPSTDSNSGVREFTTELNFYNRFPRVPVAGRVPWYHGSSGSGGICENYIAVGLR